MSQLNNKLKLDDRLMNLFSPSGQKVKGYCKHCRRYVINEDTDWAHEGYCIYCWQIREQTLRAAQEQLGEDLANGNLLHTFNKDFVDDKRFKENFTKCTRERMNETQ